MTDFQRIGIQRLSTSALAAVALIVTVGCGDFEELDTPSTCSQEQALCEAEVFLSVDEFEFFRQNSDPIILDARPDSTEFSNGHIPGAYHGSWGVHRDDQDTLWDDDEALQDYIRDIGVEADRQVIVYGAGDGSGGDSVAGNLFWTLEYVGHDDVYLVDGGLQNWIDANYDALQTGEHEPSSTDFEIERRDELLATTEDLKEVIDDDDSDTVIIDNRTEAEYFDYEDGGTPEHEQRGNPVGGHVVDAVHYHWEDVFDDDATVRDADELRDEFEELGFEPGTTTIPYCQSGVRSGYFYAVLKSLGYPEPVNYDASWNVIAEKIDSGELDEDYIVNGDELR